MGVNRRSFTGQYAIAQRGIISYNDLVVDGGEGGIGNNHLCIDARATEQK